MSRLLEYLMIELSHLLTLREHLMMVPLYAREGEKELGKKKKKLFFPHTDNQVVGEKILNLLSVRLAKIIFVNLFYYSAYFCYYS